MFTGLIQDVGRLREIRQGDSGSRIVVTTAFPMAELEIGESIAVNGICLTVTSIGSSTFAADVSPETLARSTLGELKPGDAVNLERALRLSDRLGGHLVSGHVDGIARLVERRQDRNAVRLSFQQAAAVNRYLVEKGSVAIDGISLTVNTVGSDTFSVAVIPHTLAVTTLQNLAVGGRVNIEVDLLAKYVERLLRPASEGTQDATKIDLEYLAKNGFL